MVPNGVCAVMSFLPNQIARKKPAVVAMTTMAVLLPTWVTASKLGLKLNLKPILKTMVRMKAVNTKTMPEMPATPKPGMTNISNIIRITPIMKIRISQWAASPSK